MFFLLFYFFCHCDCSGKSTTKQSIKKSCHDFAYTKSYAKSCQNLATTRFPLPLQELQCLLKPLPCGACGVGLGVGKVIAKNTTLLKITFFGNPKRYFLSLRDFAQAKSWQSTPQHCQYRSIRNIVV
ncbi:hypothetical protein [Helicobacter sp. T3_23-1056]